MYINIVITAVLTNTNTATLMNELVFIILFLVVTPYCVGIANNILLVLFLCIIISIILTCLTITLIIILIVIVIICVVILCFGDG